MTTSNYMDEEDDNGLVRIGIAFSAIAFLTALFSYIFRRMWNKAGDQQRYESGYNSTGEKECTSRKKKTGKNLMKKKSEKDFSWNKIRDVQYDHPWLLATLKGHVSQVLDIDISPNGKLLVSVCDDRSIYVWKVKEFCKREHKFSCGSFEYDTATRVAFAPDSKSLLTSLYVANKLTVCRIDRKETGNGYKVKLLKSPEFPTVHTVDINSVAFSCNGKFVVSSSSDNKIVIYSIHGDVLKLLEPKLNFLRTLTLSPCGRFLGAGGFTPDALIYEILFDRQGAFKDAVRVFELKGHNSGIHAIAFNQDSSRCATASKDGTWNLYNTNIRYALDEDAKIITRGKWDALRSSASNDVYMVMSQSGYSLVIGCGRHLKFVCLLQPDKDFSLVLDVHQNPFTRIRISACGLFLATSGDRHIRVFHNVAEYSGKVVALEEAMKKARVHAAKRRYQEELTEAQTTLKKVLGDVSS